jgi:outer membrane protein OmpA-like peptidoglycan-associated protein
MNAKLLTGMGLTLALCACVTAPRPNAALESARDAVRSAEMDPNVAKYAALDLDVAQRDLAIADDAALHHNDAAIAQPAYLAAQNAQLARMHGAAKADDARVAAGQAERTQIMLNARTREVRNAKMATNLALDQRDLAVGEAARSQGDAARSHDEAIRSQGDAARSQEDAIRSQGDAARSQEQAALSQGDAARSHDEATRSQGDAARSQEQAARSQEQAALSQGEAARSHDEATRSQGDAARSQEQSARSQEQAALSQGEAARSHDEATRSQGDAARSQGDAARSQEQSARLQAEVDQLKARPTPRGLVMTLGDVLFNTGRAELNPGANRKLDQLAQFLNEHKGRRVQIDGFTDSVGTDSYNDELSQRRANSVKSALLSRGVDSSRIGTEGYGKAYPVANNIDSGGRQLNRRVEVVIGGENGLGVSPRG